MKVKVKTVKQEVFDVELQAGMKVSDIKGAIETQVSDDKYRRDLLQIVFKGKRWTDDDASIEDMGVTEGAVIVVVAKPAAKPAEAPPAAPVEAAKPAAPAEQPAETATATPAAPPAAAAPEAAGAPAGGVGGADAFATGSELHASIKAITEMGFEEAEVKRAMRAAFNNPDRAVEYLMTGIPAGLEPPAAAAPQAPAAPAAAPAAPAATPAAPTPAAAPQAASGPNAAPLDMWGGGAAPAPVPAAPGAAGPGRGVQDLLSQVRGNPQVAQRIQQMLASDPNQLMGVLQELSRHSPEFAQQLQSNPQVTISALMNAAGVEGGAPPPGTVQVELTADDDAAVGRLEALGFSRIACIQAYIACERSEELAANYLLENATDEDMG